MNGIKGILAYILGIDGEVMKERQRAMEAEQKVAILSMVIERMKREQTRPPQPPKGGDKPTAPKPLEKTCDKCYAKPRTAKTKKKANKQTKQKTTKKNGEVGKQTV